MSDDMEWQFRHVLSGSGRDEEDLPVYRSQPRQPIAGRHGRDVRIIAEAYSRNNIALLVVLDHREAGTLAGKFHVTIQRIVLDDLRVRDLVSPM